jgi:hypothetical protein
LLGGLALALQGSAPAPVLASRIANEVLFPVGCALVLFGARAVSPRLAAPAVPAGRSLAE